MDPSDSVAFETIDDLLAYMRDEATDRFDTWTFKPIIWDDGTYRFTFEYVDNLWEPVDKATRDERREQLPDDLTVEPYSRDIVHQLDYRWDYEAVIYVRWDRIKGANKDFYTVEKTETPVADVHSPDQIDCLAIRDIV